MINSTNKGPVVIIGKRYADILKEPINKHCKAVMEMPDNPLIDGRLSGHVDLSILKIRRDEVMVPVNLMGSDIELLLKKSGINIIYTEKKQGREYPYDVPVNVCVTENSLIYNPDTADSKIPMIFGDRLLINVKQGYTGCSVCKLGKNAIITSDSGIHHSVEKMGGNSLLISPGYIDLHGFDYGFIGGASFMINGILYFTGTLENHLCWKEIEAFLKSLKIEYEFLTDLNAFDIGGAVVLE